MHVHRGEMSGLEHMISNADGGRGWGGWQERWRYTKGNKYITMQELIRKPPPPPQTYGNTSKRERGERGERQAARNRET